MPCLKHLKVHHVNTHLGLIKDVTMQSGKLKKKGEGVEF